jgi:arginine N-succinyltransferase
MKIRAVVRPVKEEDLSHLYGLALTVQDGLTNLPPSKDYLQRRIIDSLRAFDSRVYQPGGEKYLFVLEDTISGEVIGTSGIISKLGGYKPCYNFLIEEEEYSHEPLNIKRSLPVLKLNTYHDGPAEICSFYIRSNTRGSGAARPLGLGRFMFMACFPDRFESTVISEMRGWINEEGVSPFWQSVGSVFFQQEFLEADFLRGMGNEEFIGHLLPRHPIYIHLLPREARDAVARVHKQTRPAMKLLMMEGFQETKEVDIFDAGPLVRTRRDRIRTIRLHRRVKVGKIVDSISNNTTWLISNHRLDFRCTTGRLLCEDGKTATLEADTAELLEVGEGDDLVFAPMK